MVYGVCTKWPTRLWPFWPLGPPSLQGFNHCRGGPAIAQCSPSGGRPARLSGWPKSVMFRKSQTLQSPSIPLRSVHPSTCVCTYSIHPSSAASRCSSNPLLSPLCKSPPNPPSPPPTHAHRQLHLTFHHLTLPHLISLRPISGHSVSTMPLMMLMIFPRQRLHNPAMTHDTHLRLVLKRSGTHTHAVLTQQSLGPGIWETSETPQTFCRLTTSPPRHYPCSLSLPSHARPLLVVNCTDSHLLNCHLSCPPPPHSSEARIIRERQR